MPARSIGVRSSLAVQVTNDDARGDGVRPALPNAVVFIRDARGQTWTARTDERGVAHLEVEPGAGPLEITIVHPEFTREVGRIDVVSRAAAAT